MLIYSLDKKTELLLLLLLFSILKNTSIYELFA